MIQIHHIPANATVVIKTPEFTCAAEADRFHADCEKIQSALGIPLIYTTSLDFIVASPPAMKLDAATGNITRVEDGFQATRNAQAVECPIMTSIKEKLRIDQLVNLLRGFSSKGLATCHGDSPEQPPHLKITFSNLKDAQDCFETIIRLWSPEFINSITSEEKPAKEIDYDAPLPPIHEGLVYPGDAEKLRILSQKLRLVEKYLLGGTPLFRDSTDQRFEELRSFARYHGSNDFELIETIICFGPIITCPEKLMDAVRHSIRNSKPPLTPAESSQSTFETIREILNSPGASLTKVQAYRLNALIIQRTSNTP